MRFLIILFIFFIIFHIGGTVQHCTLNDENLTKVRTRWNLRFSWVCFNPKQFPLCTCAHRAEYNITTELGFWSTDLKDTLSFLFFFNGYKAKNDTQSYFSEIKRFSVLFSRKVSNVSVSLERHQEVRSSANHNVE